MKSGNIWKRLCLGISVLMMEFFFVPVQVRADVIADDPVMHYGDPAESAVVESIAVICGLIIVVAVSALILIRMKKKKEQEHITELQKINMEHKKDDEG